MSSHIRYFSEPYNFCALPARLSDWQKSRAVILPVPYEATTSYRKGTSFGPLAIISASRHLETFDEELKTETVRQVGIHTLPPFAGQSGDIKKDLIAAGELAAQIIRAGKWPVILGGEHSIAWGMVKALKKIYPDLGVLHFDAHADLRPEYLGNPLSHACALYLIRKLGCPTASVGIRSLSEEEYKMIKKEKIPMFLSPLIDGQPRTQRKIKEAISAICRILPKNIYLTFDLDAFDPALMPAVGTPEPGGLFWEEVLTILREVFARKNVVGADVLELAPLPGNPAPDFLAAKFIYRLIGYKFSRSF